MPSLTVGPDQIYMPARKDWPLQMVSKKFTGAAKLGEFKKKGGSNYTPTSVNNMHIIERWVIFPKNTFFSPNFSWHLSYGGM